MLDVWESLIPSSHLHIYEDNQACIAIVKRNQCQTQAPCKAQRVKVASTCELVNMSENILLQYCRTDEQRGDPLTKALPLKNWEHALTLLAVASERLPDGD